MCKVNGTEFRKCAALHIWMWIYTSFHSKKNIVAIHTIPLVINSSYCTVVRVRRCKVQVKSKILRKNFSFFHNNTSIFNIEYRINYKKAFGLKKQTVWQSNNVWIQAIQFSRSGKTQFQQKCVVCHPQQCVRCYRIFKWGKQKFITFSIFAYTISPVLDQINLFFCCRSAWVRKSTHT